MEAGHFHRHGLGTTTAAAGAGSGGNGGAAVGASVQHGTIGKVGKVPCLQGVEQGAQPLHGRRRLGG